AHGNDQGTEVASAHGDDGRARSTTLRGGWTRAADERPARGALERERTLPRRRNVRPAPVPPAGRSAHGTRAGSARTAGAGDARDSRRAGDARPRRLRGARRRIPAGRARERRVARVVGRASAAGEAAGAWAAAGHALAAVHSVDVGRPADEASRGTWHYEEVLANSTGSASPAQTCPRSIGCWRWSKMRARSARRLRSRSASATRIS